MSLTPSVHDGVDDLKDGKVQREEHETTRRLIRRDLCQRLRPRRTVKTSFHPPSEVPQPFVQGVYEGTDEDETASEKGLYATPVDDEGGRRRYRHGRRAVFHVLRQDVPQQIDHGGRQGLGQDGSSIDGPQITTIHDPQCRSDRSPLFVEKDAVLPLSLLFWAGWWWWIRGLVVVSTAVVIVIIIRSVRSGSPLPDVVHAWRAVVAVGIDDVIGVAGTTARADDPLRSWGRDGGSSCSSATTPPNLLKGGHHGATMT